MESLKEESVKIDTPEKKLGRPKKIVLPEEPKAEEKKEDDIFASIITDEYGAVDTWFVEKKNPKYHYRFLKADDETLSVKTGNLLFHKGGWRLCDRAHCIDIGIKERYLDPHGHYRKGQNVLAFMPKELYEKKEAKKREKADAPMQTLKRRLEGGNPNDPELRGKGHPNMRGLQTKEKLRM